ncbi:hypothetical protein ACIQYW_29170 [Rhodococcus erythropolis]|nr:hypothetical protein [uncultured Rhodococcus sp.]
MVEEYADTVIDSSDLGRDWAPVGDRPRRRPFGLPAEGGLELA